MKNKLIPHLTLLFLLVAQIIYPQSKGPSFLRLDIGGSIPLGVYAEPLIGEGGFATPGIHATFEGAYFFHKNFGIGGKSSGAQHNPDIIAITEQYGDLLDAQSGDRISTITGTWNVGSLGVGPVVDLPIGNSNWHFDASLYVGLFYALNPRIDVLVLNSTDSPQIIIEDDVAFSLGIDMSTAIAYHFTSRFGMRYYVNFLGGNPSFDLEEFKFNGPINTFNTGIGFTYFFKGKYPDASK